jgi:hypothetical protein
MHDDTQQGYDVEQASRLARQLYQSILDDPHGLDSATAFMALVFLVRNVLREIEGYAALHDVPGDWSNAREVFCTLIMSASQVAQER